jgi:geranylgeranyl pyrophosphate synthase
MQKSKGEGLALLIGDYMVFRGLKLILDAAESRNDILLAQELANAGLQIAHGEAEQLDRYLKQQRLEERMQMDNYLDLIAKKTAAFFAGCAEAGAALAGAEMKVRKLYREFGMNMGIVFQMMDDLMDVIGDPKKARKSLRNNLSEGTVTLPMIHARELYPEDQSLIRLAKGEPLDSRAETYLYRKLASKKVLQRCEETMRSYMETTKEYLNQMPRNIYSMGLADLFDYVTQCPWGGLEGKINKKENPGGKKRSPKTRRRPKRSS